MPALATTSGFPNDTTLRGIHMIVYQAWSQREPVGRQIFNVFDSNQIRHSVGWESCRKRRKVPQ